MVSPDPMSRPSANRLASLQSLRGTNSSNNKSRSQLYQELKETKAKLRLLEQQLDATNIATNGATSCDTPKSTNSQSGRLLIGRGCAKSRSFKLWFFLKFSCLPTYVFLTLKQLYFREKTVKQTISERASLTENFVSHFSPNAPTLIFLSFFSSLKLCIWMERTNVPMIDTQCSNFFCPYIYFFDN